MLEHDGLHTELTEPGGRLRQRLGLPQHERGRALAEAYQRGPAAPQREELRVDSLSESESTELAVMLLGRDDETHRGDARRVRRAGRGAGPG